MDDNFFGQFTFHCKGSEPGCRAVILFAGVAISEAMDRYKLTQLNKGVAGKVADWQLDCFYKEGKECK